MGKVRSHLGRCFGSKSAYRAANPKCEFIANANVCTKKLGKIWWGDLDLKHDQAALEKIAHSIGQRLYVLREGDARGNEEICGQEVPNRAMWCTGGRLRIPGVTEVLKESGLTKNQLAKLLGVTPSFLTKRYPPVRALHLGQHIENTASYCRFFVEETPHLKWGHWLLQSNPELGGDTPFAVLKANQMNRLAPLLRK